MRLVLVSNGPGELYTWVRPVLREIRHRLPEAHASIALIPCQFAGGAEAEIAATFEPDALTTPAQFLRAAATGSAPAELRPAPGEGGAVIGLGGNGALAVKLGRSLGLPAFRYSFEPVWLRGLEALLLPDPGTQQRAVRGGAPSARTAVVGNLVADAVEAAEGVPDRGAPHVLLFAGSRDAFALHLIPTMGTSPSQCPAPSSGITSGRFSGSTTTLGTPATPSSRVLVPGMVTATSALTMWA